MAQKSTILPNAAIPSRNNQSWDRIAFLLSLGAAMIVIINYMQTRRDHKIQRQILMFNLAKFKAEAKNNPELQAMIAEMEQEAKR